MLQKETRTMAQKANSPKRTTSAANPPKAQEVVDNQVLVPEVQVEPTPSPIPKEGGIIGCGSEFPVIVERKGRGGKTLRGRLIHPDTNAVETILPLLVKTGNKRAVDAVFMDAKTSGLVARTIIKHGDRFKENQRMFSRIGPANFVEGKEPKPDVPSMYKVLDSNDVRLLEEQEALPSDTE